MISLVVAGWLRLPVGLSAGADQDGVGAVSGQVPGLELGVWADEQFGAVVEADAQRASVADLDRGDGLLEQVEDRCQAGPGAGIEFVPFAVGIAKQERCLDDQFSVNAVALVWVTADEAESDLVVERGAPHLAVDQGCGYLHRTSCTSREPWGRTADRCGLRGVVHAGGHRAIMQCL